MVFFTTLSVVAVLLLYAVPGFALVKSKLIKGEAIPAFAKVLLYVCQPCLSLYSFNKADFSVELLCNLGVFFVIVFLIQLGLLLGFFALFRTKSRDDIRYRILNIAFVLGNCGFFGVPIVEQLMPDRSEAPAMCMVFAFSLNLLCWTVVTAIITRDKKYLSVKQALLNPAIIAFVLALVLFVARIKLPGALESAVTLVGTMSTPLCMIILGMRLALVKPKPLFCSPMQYLAVAVKQLAVPLLVFATLYFFPLDPFLKQVIFVLFCCPIASNVLNFAEIVGKGQDTAANCVLLGTLLCIATMPLMMLLTG